MGFNVGSVFEDGFIACFDCKVFGFCLFFKSYNYYIFDKPKSSPRRIRHGVASLHLNSACGVVEMDCDASKAF